MTAKIKIIYEGARNNEAFLLDIKDTDGDKKPSRIFASSLEEHVFAIMYYGWLVGKYGIEWEKNI